MAAAVSNDRGSGNGTGRFGPGFGGGGGGGGGGSGGQCITSSPIAGYSKQQETGLVIPSNSPSFGTGMPSSSAGGNGSSPMVCSSGWNYMPNGTAGFAGRPELDSATFGNAVIGSGMQCGASGPGMGGNVNGVFTPGDSSGISASAGMPVASSYVDGTAGGGAVVGNGGINSADVNIGRTAGANVVGTGFGMPECHNPLAGGVPVLPDVSARLLLSELLNVFRFNSAMKMIRIVCCNYCYSGALSSFSSLVLLVRRQKGRLACKRSAMIIANSLVSGTGLTVIHMHAWHTQHTCTQTHGFCLTGSFFHSYSRLVYSRLLTWSKLTWSSCGKMSQLNKNRVFVCVRACRACVCVNYYFEFVFN